MGRKYQYIYTFLLTLMIVFTLQITKDNDSPIENITTVVETTKDNTELVTTEEDPLISLIFDEGVIINEIKSFNDAYIAIGEDENIPFMQMIYVENNQITKKGTPYLFTNGVGNVIDITSNDYYISATIQDYESIYTQDFIEFNDEFIPFYKKQIQYNYNKELTIQPEYIVIHETANTKVGADANAHYRYWNSNPTANASTHFVVDNTQIYQMLELNQSAWHVGDNHDHSDITNVNSIGIEVAVNADGDFSVARQNAINLTINLMKELDMNISQLKRHYDASGKYCPTNMLQSPELWDDFVQQVQAGLEA